MAGNEQHILFVLNNLGRLPRDFDDSWLKNLLTSNNHKIRLHAVKNIGKTGNLANLRMLVHIAMDDSSTAIRREAVSAIGRMKHDKAIPYLCSLLTDNDPKNSEPSHQGAIGV